jgi:hypothetical protein
MNEKTRRRETGAAFFLSVLALDQAPGRASLPRAR